MMDLSTSPEQQLRSTLAVLEMLLAAFICLRIKEAQEKQEWQLHLQQQKQQQQQGGKENYQECGTAAKFQNMKRDSFRKEHPSCCSSRNENQNSVNQEEYSTRKIRRKKSKMLKPSRENSEIYTTIFDMVPETKNKKQHTASRGKIKCDNETQTTTMETAPNKQGVDGISEKSVPQSTDPIQETCGDDQSDKQETDGLDGRNQSVAKPASIKSVGTKVAIPNQVNDEDKDNDIGERIQGGISKNHPHIENETNVESTDAFSSCTSFDNDNEHKQKEDATTVHPLKSSSTSPASLPQNPVFAEDKSSIAKESVSEGAVQGKSPEIATVEATQKSEIEHNKTTTAKNDYCQSSQRTQTEIEPETKPSYHVMADEDTDTLLLQKQTLELVTERLRAASVSESATTKSKHTRRKKPTDMEIVIPCETPEVGTQVTATASHDPLRTPAGLVSCNATTVSQNTSDYGNYNGEYRMANLIDVNMLPNKGIQKAVNAMSVVDATMQKYEDKPRKKDTASNSVYKTFVYMAKDKKKRADKKDKTVEGRDKMKPEKSLSMDDNFRDESHNAILSKWKKTKKSTKKLFSSSASSLSVASSSFRLGRRKHKASATSSLGGCSDTSTICSKLCGATDAFALPCGDIRMVDGTMQACGEERAVEVVREEARKEADHRSQPACDHLHQTSTTRYRQ